MINRRLIFVLVTNLLLSACASLKPGQGTNRQSPTGADANAPSLAAAAARITDACSVIPADLAQKIVPGGSAPQSEKIPPRCTITNGKSVLEITFDTGPSDPVNGVPRVSGRPR